MVRIAIIGNCQASILAACMRRARGVQITAVADVNVRGSDVFNQAVERIVAQDGIDVVFSQHLSDDFGGIATSYLQRTYRDSFRLITNIYFAGLHPDLTYFGSFERRVSSPLGDYHSKLAITGFVKGYSVPECLKLFRGEIYERLNYFAVFEQSSLELLRRDASNDVRYASAFMRLTRSVLTMLSVNHPTSSAVVGLAEQIVASATGTSTPLLPDSLSNGLHDSLIWPIYPEICEAHELCYQTPFLFYPHVSSGVQPMTLSEFIERSYDRYDQVGLSNILELELGRTLQGLDLETDSAFSTQRASNVNLEVTSSGMDTDFRNGDFLAMRYKSEALLERDDEDSRATIYRAIAFDRMGDRESSIRTLAEYASLKPFNPDVYLTLCQFVLGRGAPYGELKLLRGLFDKLPQATLDALPKLEFFRAEVDFYLGERESALSRMAALPSDVVAPQYFAMFDKRRATELPDTTDIDNVARWTLLGDYKSALRNFGSAARAVTPGTTSDATLMQMCGRLEASREARTATDEMLSFDITGCVAFEPGRPLVFDTILYSGEEDLLDLKLNAMGDFVDHFVLVQGDRSFTGLKKEISSPLQNPRFQKFLPRLTHISLRFKNVQSPLLEYAWFVEALHRNAAHRTILNQRASLPISEQDTHILSDVDEVIRHGALQTFTNGSSEVRAVRLREHKYYLNLRYFGDAPQLSAGLPTLTTLVTGRLHASSDPQTLRNVIARDPSFIGGSIVDGGWHFSSVGDAGSLKRKYVSYSHVENHLKTRPEAFFASLLEILGAKDRTWEEKQTLLMDQGLDVSGFSTMRVDALSYPEYIVNHRHLFDGMILPQADEPVLNKLVDMLHQRTYAH